mmetsp:Transcript_83854/g.130918  ORF Transcript_83854/g.130918 Transcript_83854/m.130918 type:complete len:254 (-) Transcript_83854:65-826(-)
MKIALAWLWGATALVSHVSSGSAKTEVFAYVHEGDLFGTCLNAVQRAEVPGVPFTKACQEAFSSSSSQAASVSDDCAELAGRASEALDQGFLGDGRLMCGQFIRERAAIANRPLAAFTPIQGGAALVAFCDIMHGEAVPLCTPVSALRSTAESSGAAILPAAATTVVRAAPALRAAEVKPVRLIPEPVMTTQMQEAAQTIAAGVFPAFARQVPQALAAGLAPPPQAAMNAKVETGASNGDIWSNLAALLHRTG